MASKKNLIPSSLLALALPLCLHAETAADYLHRGAQDYIFGYEDEAKKSFAEGVTKFPDDRALREALALIREQKKSQQQSGSGQDQKKNQDKKDGGEGKSDETKPADEKDGDQKKKNDEGAQKMPDKDGKNEQSAGKKDGQEKPGEDPSAPDKKLSGELKANPSDDQNDKADKDAKAEAEAEEIAAAEGTMTEKQAKALLDSLKGEDEKVRLFDPNERKRLGRVLRDW